MTDIERKERAKAAKRKSYLKHKDKYRAQQKADREANPEKYADYQREYQIKHKDKLNAVSKEYYKNNKEAQIETQKKWKENNKEHLESYQENYYKSLKDGLFTVYYLKEEHYIGQTNSIQLRMNSHKCNHKRHVLDVEILGKFETRKEALAFEAKLHLMGYNG